MPESTLAEMAAVRLSVWNSRAAHPRVVQMELLAHQLACQDYSVDILRHLIDIEQASRPCLASFQAQPEINVHMRTLIFDFAMCCHTRLGLSTSTLYLCFSVIDRYCSRIVVKSSTYQLVALCGLWLASKYIDRKPRVPSLRALQNLCCNQYSRSQFQDMELHILKALNWSPCNAPPHDVFVDILLKNKISSLSYKGLHLNDLKYGSCMLCELACFEHVLAFDYNASAVALAAVTLTTHALRLSVDGQFVHYSSMLKDANLQRVCDLVLRKLRSRNFPSSFKLKYLGQNKLESNPILRSLLEYELMIAPPIPMQAVKKPAYASFSPSKTGPCANVSPAPSVGFQDSFTGNSFRSPRMVAPPTPCTPSNLSSGSVPKVKTPSLNLSPGTSNSGKHYEVSQAKAAAVRPTMFRRNDSKRNSDIMEPDFFDMATASNKRAR
ncbi:LAQU0S01e15522g1_1 [Lachancea quebecensis]|uniref:LAQU0S01e15522g1_1 n=1 Tax=Lachancea quebecensis TaxID=1654605 RepID=A0A0P1KM79_9SACH|nr:LAQU0S01e15522g1_1 [Lachancea quebecensis]